MAELCKLSATLRNFDFTTAKQYKVIVVVTSTYGDGGAPENAERFENWLEKENSTDLLSGVHYAVLALGSSMYPFPFKFGSTVNRRFAQLGGRQLISEEKIDEIKYNSQDVFTNWSGNLFDAISKHEVYKSSRELVAKNKMLGFQNFDFNVLQAPFKLSFTATRLPKEPRDHYQNKVVVVKVVTNNLVNYEPTNQIYSIDLEFAPGTLEFTAGDNAIVMPSNPTSEVDELIARLGFEKDKVFDISGQDMNQVSDLECSLGNNKCTLEIALTYYYDITSPPSASLLKFLAMQSNEPADQEEILSYTTDYLSFLKLNLSVLELLESNQSIQLRGDEEKLAVFLGMLGPIKQRHYSIANFPPPSSNILRIVYKVVAYQTKSGKEKYGLCSNYLKGRKVGEEVVVGVVKSKFRLPSDSLAPIIMVGAGSGVSPYFGFVEQQTLGKAVLIHGCRSEEDFACKPTIDAAVNSGIISDLWPAYSRKAGLPRTRIQDVLLQNGEQVWKLINSGATMYVCGDVAVGMSIRDALAQVAQVNGKYGPYKSHTWVLDLINKGQLRNDEWGIATSSGADAVRAARLKLWRKSILAIFAFAKKQ